MKQKRALEEVLKELALILEQDYLKILLVIDKGNVKIRLIQCQPDPEDEGEDDEGDFVDYLPTKPEPSERVSYLG